MSLELTTEQIQAYIPVANSFVPDNFQTYIRSAERTFMHKYLSKGQYEALISQNADDSITEQIKRATICLAYYKYIPFSAVYLSNAGITQMRSETQVAAKESAVEDLKNACYNEGFEELESILLAFEAAPETYNLWASSAAATITNQLIFRNATDFSRFVNIRELRRVFVTLLPSIRTLQFSKIREALGKLLLADLLETVSDNNTELIEYYLKPALAHLAIADALPNLSVQLGAYDMVLLFDNTGSNRQSKIGTGLDAKTLDYLVKSYETKGETLLDELCDYLMKNVELYPLYNLIENTYFETSGLIDEGNVIGF